MRVWCECSSGLGIASLSLMVAAASLRGFRDKQVCFVAVTLLLAMTLGPVLNQFDYETVLSDARAKAEHTNGGTEEVWLDGGQPWPQFGRTGSRVADTPIHGPEGGAGFGSPSNTSVLMSIIDPSVNWAYGSYSIGTDSLGTPIADLSGSIEVDEGAEDRCGRDSLFSVLVQTVEVSGSQHSMLRVIEGEDADLAWQVDLGSTEVVKAAPVIVDIDDDGRPEILVAYDAVGTLFVDAWSPRLSCSVTGWSYSSHSEELLWTWSDESKKISSDEGPYTSSLLGGHKPTTQPLLADLDLDGDAELVLAVLDEVSEDPIVLAFPLQINGTPSTLWEVTLDKGSHPSDPAFAQVDDSTGYVLLTTIEANNGGMWVWKIDSSTGDSSWDGGLSLDNLDGDTNAPHVRLPGPVIANLDSDSDPEMIVTIPSDADGSSAVDGAEFRGIEIDDGGELWSFEASNGFADAPPTAIDTDGDGEHDRVCWVTWWQGTMGARHGQTGCHDVGGDTPDEAWNRDLEQSSGNPNDEIAVAAASWMDIDGEDAPELLVAFGRSLWAFDGASGTSLGVNAAWSDELELDHRTWSSPSLADMDGDATLDLVIASMVVSVARPDVRPLTDGRGIEFNPSAPDPGEQVTVTAFLENAGTADTNEITDAVLYADGIEIGREGIANLEPVDPSGPGSFASFSVEWSGALGDHIFELILDPYGNLTQTRFDNDLQIKTLSIVPPYNASFEMPTDPLRVDPGSSEVAPINIRSTGRLSGIWSLGVDDSNLPAGWSWVDETPGGISSVEIGVDGYWSPNLRVNAPDDALGSDSGHLGLTISLDDDHNVSVSSTLPLEANRTRGLSIRGPDGTSTSTGFGLIGEDARAWLIVENVGNAAETQIAISWDGTDWGSDLMMYDSDGSEVSALTLGPGEQREMTSRLHVPSEATHGDSVSTPLTMCVGAGEEQECSEVSLVFVASGVVLEPSHLRSVPSDGLVWNVTADLPMDSDNLTWSLSGTGMGIGGWTWGGGGQLSIAGDSIALSGTPGTRTSGSLSLDLPADAPPGFHAFENEVGSGSAFPLRLSLEVMQIHRAGMLVTSPISQPFVIDVDEPSLTILRLENLGNGQDSYLLSYSILLDDNITSDPGVVVSFTSNPTSLSAGSLQTVPLSITFPNTTPARVPIGVQFTMTSIGNESVTDSEVVEFEVRQDHHWDFVTSLNGKDVNGSTFLLVPGQTVTIPVNATNLGNLADDLDLEVQTEISRMPGDESSGWNASGSSALEVGVNQSTMLNVTATASPDAWNGSKLIVTVNGFARDQSVVVFSFALEALHIPSWGVIANDADLEIDPEGSQIELTLVQMGNAPSQPFASMYVTGESGWDIDTLGGLPTISPGDTSPLLLNITPPDSALHGKSVELHIRVREGDSSGLAEVTLPLRVAITYDFVMDGEGPWVISRQGGHPQVTVQNLGNAPTTISLQVLSLPEGWAVAGSTEVVLGVGEVRGVPIEVIPSEGWDGDVKTIRILAQDLAGDQQEVMLDTFQTSHSWSSSPYINALEGDEAIIEIHGTDSSSTVVDSHSGTLTWSQMGWLLPVVSSGSGEITVEQDTSLPYVLNAFEASERPVLCSIDGDIPLIFTTCSIGNGSEQFGFSVLLIDDEGAMIDSFSDSLTANSTGRTINLSAEDWQPEPGKRVLTIKLLDAKGREVGSTHKTFDIRRSDWNVGLVGLEMEGRGTDQKIKVLTKRMNENLLAGADCTISLTAGSHYSEHVIDMTTVYVPTPSLDRPDVSDGTEAIVEIGCAFPWDVDLDPMDDEARIVLSGASVIDQGLDDMDTGALAALLVIGVYAGLAWIVSNYRERERLMAITRTAVEEKMTQMRVETEEKTEEEPNEEDEEGGEDEVPESDEDVEPVDEFEMRMRRILDRG